MNKICAAIFVAILFVVLPAKGQQFSLNNDLGLKYLVNLPPQSNTAAPIVILLHGYGSNEQDLFELRKAFPTNFIVVAVRAPYELPQGGYQWFERDLLYSKYTGKKDQLAFSRGKVAEFIPLIVKKYKANPAKVYLMGFSQGAIMSYEVGLTSPQIVTGIGILSGVLPQSLKALIKRTGPLSRLQIFVSHGAEDKVLLYTDGKAAADYLMSIGLNPEFHRYEQMGHSISNEVLIDLLKWLKR